jgi:hypothetical protein
VHRLEELDNVPSKATTKQRLCGTMRKVLGIEIDPDGDIFEGITAEQSEKLIETLKRYVRNAERKVKKKGVADGNKPEVSTARTTRAC